MKCIISVMVIWLGITPVFGKYPLSNQYTFNSQASQDHFVYTLLYDCLGKQDQGYYLEIGAAEPIFTNNSYFFENFLAWNGLSIDISHNYLVQWNSSRKNPLLIEDATQSNYIAILSSFPKVIDYLSLDIDGYYDIVLQKLPLNDYIFKIITIEHDFYLHGDIHREKERKILASHGYHLLCSDVLFQGGSFEDWWIHPSAFPPSVFSALTFLDLKEKDHKQIIAILKSVPSTLFNSRH